MIIKLTNNFGTFKGTPIYINVDNIVSFFDIEIDGMFHTKVYGNDKNATTWDVEEPASQIYKMINNTEQKWD